MSRRIRPSRPHGFSLIELMIAMLIGTILMMGVVQVFMSARKAYQLSQGIARNQESARFAMDFITRDLRMVGHTGCINDQQLLRDDGDPTAPRVIGGNVRSLFLSKEDRENNDVDEQPFPLRFDVAIQGFEANNTAPNGSINVQTAPAVGAAGNWTPALPDELSARRPIAGSDIVMLRYLSAEQAPVTLTLGAASTVTYPTADAALAQQGDGLFALADCRTASVFQASTTPGTTQFTVEAGSLNKSALTDLGGGHDGTSLCQGVCPAFTLYRAVSVAYYVALNPQNVPSLYRARWVATPGSSTLAVTAEELVEGVESLQLLYGEDKNSGNAANLALSPSGFVDKTNTAATIGGITTATLVKRWRRVEAVQVGFLMRGGGSERAAAEQASTPLRLLQVRMNAPNDGHYRSVYENTVALRNRLVANTKAQ